MTAQPWMVLLGAYLLGSIPTAYIVARFIAGKDIRRLGDGNIGAKNTFESVGRLAGMVVAFIDVGKGVLTVTMARHFSVTDEVILLAGLGAVLGHDFSVFLRFQGGQGMATTLGIFLALFPLESALGLVAFTIVLAVTRNWDLSCGDRICDVFSNDVENRADNHARVLRHYPVAVNWNE